jgi:hypothetical protein
MRLRERLTKFPIRRIGAPGGGLRTPETLLCRGLMPRSLRQSCRNELSIAEFDARLVVGSIGKHVDRLGKYAKPAG